MIPISAARSSSNPSAPVAALRAATLCLGLAAASVLPAQDLDRERRLASEIVDSIMDGEAVILHVGEMAKSTAKDAKFLAIYTESEIMPAHGAAIVLHGRGFHPDWAEVVRPLRTVLPEHGWHTLALQMPVLEKDATYYDYVPIFPAAFPRIVAGIAFLREQGISRIVIIAHSCSVHMTMAYIEAFGDAEIAAFVGIGMGATDFGQPMKKPFPLERMTVPVLDVFGSDDFPAVVREAPARAAAEVSAGNALSRQVMVEGADHYFTDKDDELIAVVSAWLESLRR
jgi:pimeloyl-ACP methyl ester carboxylesterase